MNVVEVTNLQIDYDEVRAVDDVSFTLEKGKIYGFVGPNGAGKTSTIKALAGVLEPTQGTIILNGHDLERERQKALVSVSYMPDFPPVYENLKVWEFLDVFAAAYGIDRGRVSQWIEKVDLTTKKDALIKGLSRGMRQRLIMAKALQSFPAVLLLDEPASGLDPVARKQMRDLLKEAAANGASILISSHILTELSDFVDGVIILEKGKLVVSGSIDEIRGRMGAGQKLVIRFARPEEGMPVLTRLLAESGIAGEHVSKDKDRVVIQFAQDDGTASAFLNKLLASGAVLAECSVKSDDIEDIFFKVGAKEVA